MTGILLGGCLGGEFKKEIKNGYFIARTNSYTTAIFSPNGDENKTHSSRGIAVPPNIVSCLTEGSFAWGEIIFSEKSELAFISKNGWFILNLNNGDVKSFSVKIDFEKEKERLGIKEIDGKSLL